MLHIIVSYTYTFSGIGSMLQPGPKNPLDCMKRNDYGNMKQVIKSTAAEHLPTIQLVGVWEINHMRQSRALETRQYFVKPMRFGNIQVGVH